MDKTQYLQRLQQILEEIELKQEFLDGFRDRRPGYIEGYANALSEMMIKIRAIKLLIEKIDEEDKHEA